jgi:copper chaperone NosL
MKRILLLVCLSFLLSSLPALAHEDVEPPKSCQQCGMNRAMFAQSRMVVVYSDGKSVGTCSLHCTATEVRASAGRKVASLQVADFTSKALIDAKSAVWVIGGAKTGVMTEVGKWAFAKKQDAEAFIKGNGGRIADFDEAMALADKEQY